MLRSPMRIADNICHWLDETLKVPVVVVDTRNVIIAASRPGVVGFPLENSGLPYQAPALRLPLALDDHQWTVVLLDVKQDGPLVTALAEQLVKLLVESVPAPESTIASPDLRSMFLYDLLQGTLTDEDAARRTAQMLGLRIDQPRAVLLIDAGAYILRGGRTSADIRFHERQRVTTVTTALETQLPGGADPLCSYIGEGEVACLVGLSDPARPIVPGRWADLAGLKIIADNLQRRFTYQFQHDCALGLGRYYDSVPGIARSYRDARAALDLGRSLRGSNQVYCLDALGPAMFVGPVDIETKLELARQLLAPLLAESELHTTLLAFFEENASIVGTAQRLSIHRNTLSYRLDKVATLTGQDPRRLDDATQLYLALLLLKLPVFRSLAQTSDAQ